jgi:hypothetical protein
LPFQDRLKELDENTGGAATKRLAGSRLNPATTTVVMHPLTVATQPDGGAYAAARPSAGNIIPPQSANSMTSTAFNIAARPSVAPISGFSASCHISAPSSGQVGLTGRMAQFVDTVTIDHAAAINAAICAFIVGCGLPFAIVESIFFIQLLELLRPAFIQRDHLRRRTWFSTVGLDNLYFATQSQLSAAFQAVAASTFFTLAGDGFKTEAGDKVVNFTEQQGNMVAFKDSITVGEDREDAQFYVKQFKEQLIRGPGGTAETESPSPQAQPKISDKWSAVVADNVGYMRSALNTIEILFPTLLCYGCVAHLLDLLCEDYAKLLHAVLQEAILIVNFVLVHDRARELFYRLKGPTGIGLRTYPETRFSYAALMLNNVIKNKRHLQAMPDDEKWDSATTNKDGSHVSNRQEFENLVLNRPMWDRISCAIDLLQPVAAALRFIEGDRTRLSFVYLIMLKLFKVRCSLTCL